MFKKTTAYEMRISDLEFRRVLFRSIPDAIDGGQVDRLRVGGAQLAGFAVLRQRRQIHRARLAFELRDRVELAADLEDRREIVGVGDRRRTVGLEDRRVDRKSTSLNSSH